MRKFGLLLLFIGFVGIMQSQGIVKSLERNVPGQGKVTIHQDPRIEALLGTGRTVAGESSVIRASGYRVQVYAGPNSRVARSEAESIASRVKEYFPDLKIYTFFTSPRWLCRVGDFRSIEEADAMMRKLRSTGVFKEVSIVKDQVTISL